MKEQEIKRCFSSAIKDKTKEDAIINKARQSQLAVMSIFEELRKSKGITRKQLAVSVGISKTQLKALFSCDIFIDLLMISIIADALDANIHTNCFKF